MAYINGRGHFLSIDVTQFSDYIDTAAMTSSGVATDLTGATVSSKIYENGKEIGAISHEITDVAGGLFELKFPSSYFANRDGETLHFETKAVISGDDFPLCYGDLNINEVGSNDC